MQCAIGEQLFTANMRTGTITRWSGLEKDKQFDRDLAGSKIGIIGIQVVGEWLVTHTYEDVMVQYLDGKVAGSWEPHKGRVHDVWLDVDGLLVAAGTKVARVDRRALGC